MLMHTVYISSCKIWSGGHHLCEAMPLVAQGAELIFEDEVGGIFEN